MYILRGSQIDSIGACKVNVCVLHIYVRLVRPAHLSVIRSSCTAMCHQIDLHIYVGSDHPAYLCGIRSSCTSLCHQIVLHIYVGSGRPAHLCVIRSSCISMWDQVVLHTSMWDQIVFSHIKLGSGRSDGTSANRSDPPLFLGKSRPILFVARKYFQP